MSVNDLTDLLHDPPRGDAPPASLGALIEAVAAVCAKVSDTVGRSALPARESTVTGVNIQGERQTPLDVLSNELFMKDAALNRLCAGLASCSPSATVRQIGCFA